MAKNFHESYEQGGVSLPSDRSIGALFTAVALIAAYLSRFTEIALAVAAILAVVTLVRPRLLRPLNIAWMKLSEILGKIVTPIVLLVLYAVVIVPAGLLLQLRMDPLHRKKNPDDQSYWTPRDPAAGQSSMTNQF